MSPDNHCAMVSQSKASAAGIILNFGGTDLHAADIDCGAACHGSFWGPKRGGGFFWCGSSTYQDR